MEARKQMQERRAQLPEDEISLFEATHTQRAIRSFRPDPIPREQIVKMIETATKAPSGSNTQPWAFIVLQDRGKVAELAKFTRPGFQAMLDQAAAGVQPGATGPLPSLDEMVEGFGRIPLIVVVCMVNPPGETGRGDCASIYPAIQNLLLAARALGIGATLTDGWTYDSDAETWAVRKLLNIPEHVEPIAFIPMGYPDKERYGKTTRRPWAEVTHWDGWEGEKENSARPPNQTTGVPSWPRA